MSQDEITPNTAPLVAHALGAERAGAIDIGAACTGFLAALRMAAGQIEAGRAERVLRDRRRDPDPPAPTSTTRRPRTLFGDGAGAVVLGADGDGAASARSTLAADGALGHAIIALATRTA